MNLRQVSIVIFVLFIGITMTSIQAGATSPRYMKLQYQQNSLSVTILHFSPVKSVHYVYKVDVEKNGELVVSQLYQDQQKFFFYTYTYTLTAATGDSITVTTYCSLFGKLTRSITIA